MGLAQATQVKINTRQGPERQSSGCRPARSAGRGERVQAHGLTPPIFERTEATAQQLEAGQEGPLLLIGKRGGICPRRTCSSCSEPPAGS